MPTTAETSNRPRRRTSSTWVVPATAVVIGVVFFAVQYAHGRHSDAVSSLVIMVLFAAVLAIFGNRSETVSLLRGGDGDERARHIATRALATTGGLLCLVLPVGLIIQTARGADTAVWSGLCALAGVVFVGALATLKHRG
jgi:drug/metabolite transporter (DMT)-like permease